MRLSTSGYSGLTKSLCDIADTHCHGRIVAVTEGGYDLNALKACLESSIAVLDGAPVLQPKEPLLAATQRSRMAIAAGALAPRQVLEAIIVVSRQLSVVSSQLSVLSCQ